MRSKIPLGKEEFQCMKFSPYQAPYNGRGKDGGAQSADNKERRALRLRRETSSVPGKHGVEDRRCDFFDRTLLVPLALALHRRGCKGRISFADAIPCAEVVSLSFVV